MGRSQPGHSGEPIPNFGKIPCVTAAQYSPRAPSCQRIGTAPDQRPKDVHSLQTETAPSNQGAQVPGVLRRWRIGSIRPVTKPRRIRRSSGETSTSNRAAAYSRRGTDQGHIAGSHSPVRISRYGIRIAECTRVLQPHLPVRWSSTPPKTEDHGPQWEIDVENCVPLGSRRTRDRHLRL